MHKIASTHEEQMTRESPLPPTSLAMLKNLDGSSNMVKTQKKLLIHPNTDTTTL